MDTPFATKPRPFSRMKSNQVWRITRAVEVKRTEDEKIAVSPDEPTRDKTFEQNLKCPARFTAFCAVRLSFQLAQALGEDHHESLHPPEGRPRLVAGAS